MEPLDHAVLDEIALEGLDGITLKALFCRLQNRPNFPLNAEEPDVQEYIWKCIICNKRILSLRCLQIFQLPEAREEFVYYDRRQNLQTNTGIFNEHNVDIPVDIYAPFQPQNDATTAVIGSCKFFDSRKEITPEFLDKPVTLNDVLKKYGNELVIVASQELRKEALGINSTDTTANIPEAVYCYLEKIGRSRHLGVPTVGKEAPQIEPRTIFYYRKSLTEHQLIRSSQFTINNASNVTVKGRIAFLKRFYSSQPSLLENMALQVSDFLSQQENNESDWTAVNNLLDGHSKKAIHNMLAAYNRNFQLTVKAFKNDSRFSKRKIRLIEPVSAETFDDEIPGGDEEDFSLGANSTLKSELVDDANDDQARPFDPRLILADRTLLSQVLTLIEKSSGMTMVEIANRLNLNKLDVRNIVTVLLRRGLVNTHKEVHGKTKVNIIVPLHKICQNDERFTAASQGLSHDSKNDTLAYLNRANIILKLIEESPDKIVLSLNPLVLEIQRIENSNSLVDRKTVLRIVRRLDQEGKLKHYITDHAILNRSIKLIAICHSSIGPDDEKLRDLMWKWKNRISSESSTPDAPAGDADATVGSRKLRSKRSKEAKSTNEPRKKRKRNEENTPEKKNNPVTGNEIAIIECDSPLANTKSPVDRAIYILEPVTGTSVQQTCAPGTSTLSTKRKGNSSTSFTRTRAKLFDESSQHIVLQPQPKKKRAKVPTKQRQRKAKYDEKDQQALSKLMTMRCRWSNGEDRFLIFCRVASLLLDPTCNTNVCVQARLIRDELQKRVPAASNKTGKACQRRILYLLKNSLVRQQVSGLVSEFRQSTLGAIKKPSEPKTNEDVWNAAFLDVLQRVLDKFSSPADEEDENIDLTQYQIEDETDDFGSVTPAFFEPKDVNDLKENSISNVLISSLLINKLKDGQIFREKLSNIYKQFAETMIRSVINRFKQNSILANIKKPNPRESEQISQRSMSFKISAHCDLLLQTKLTMEKLIRPLGNVNEQIVRKENRDRSDACFTTSLFACRKAKFSLKIPEDHITLQEKCPFFKPPAESSSSPCPSSSQGKTQSQSQAQAQCQEKNTNAVVERHKSSRSFLFALREQLDINGAGNSKQEKLSDFLLVNECPVDVEVTSYLPMVQSFNDALEALCEPVIGARSEPMCMLLQNENESSSGVTQENCILTFVQGKRELGASTREIISHFGYWPRVQVEQLITRKLLFRVGVDTFHLVHVNYIDHWLVCTVNEQGESIKFIPKVWTNAIGEPEKRLIYQLMSTLLGYIVQKPGVTVSALLSHFHIIAPAVQLMEILELLVSAGCISLTQLESIAKPKLFAPVMEIKSINLQKGTIGQEVSNEHLFCEAMPEAVIKLGRLRSLLTCAA